MKGMEIINILLMVLMAILFTYLFISGCGIHTKKNIYTTYDGKFFTIIAYRDPNFVCWRQCKKFLFWYKEMGNKSDFWLDWVDGEFTKIS